MSEPEITFEQESFPKELPLYMTDDLVIFPRIVTHLVVNEKEYINMVNDILDGGKKMMTIALKRPGPDGQSRINEPYSNGCVVSIGKMLRIPDGTIRLIIQGISRVKINLVRESDKNYPLSGITKLKSTSTNSDRLEVLTRRIQEEFGEIIDSSQQLPYEMKVALANITDPGSLADLVGANLNIRPDERQEILATIDTEKRLNKVSQLVNRELKLAKLGTKIQTEVTGSIEKNQREYFLKEQLKAIRKELGEDNNGAENKELQNRLEALDAPEQVKAAAKKELEKLDRISPSSSEYTVTHTYLNWLLDVPWAVSSKDSIKIAKAREILDEEHYGLNDVKERILEYLAVRKLRGTGRGSIVCFAGPPGVGKTSIGKSIGKALGRKFVRMSLGGVRDEAEIRGHRRTYVGALPGRIIQNIKRAGTNNPVFMLDEIDKLGSDFRGDPSSAMLEVLDPEQNFSFQDNYLEVDFDLSKVIFITTANYLETIPPPLRDRMEIIRLPGYITTEKIQIAKRHLIPRQIEENGLKPNQIKFSDRAVEIIVAHYTREAGVRWLERTIGKVCRKVAVQVVDKDEKKKFSVTAKNVSDYLGPAKIMNLVYTRKPQVGIANGLAWTSVGGVMLYIEAIAMPGQGRLKITGQLGSVMKESADIALSYIRKNAKKLKIPKEFFSEHDIHVHIPEGATPKDGPSAGITLTTAMASLFSGRPVRNDIAMTGEITLQGRVLPIGGLREKSVAASRAHMKTVICPIGNKSDLEEIPEIVREKTEFKFVSSIDEVLKSVLLPKP
ncbi:MAG: endopeptidase La [Calditrichaeota bacterium]|jgi:ATP-dependent Lon protease|nr:endopeptidase La [Calditrichota bacterium]MBT7618808.1 endopeptidase La [Calditrichota bacterium]MBT7787535.1 endopeptidase La [Calditrichota bacterium]